MRFKLKLLSICAVPLLLVSSCAKDDFDNDEIFTHDVRNTEMRTLAASEINISSSADKSRTIVSWPLQYGALGYKITLTNVSSSNGSEVVVDTIVDGYTINLPREADQEYTISILPLGDKSLSNTNAVMPTLVAFDSYIIGYATIPDNTDLYTYFKDNPIPDNADELTYDLVKGGKYTISGSLDLGNHWVGLRTLGGEPHATITYADGANLQFSNGLTLNNIDFDVKDGKDFLQMSKDPSFAETKLTDANGGEASSSALHITNPISISNCNVYDVKNTFITDNGGKYWVKDLIIKNTLVRFKTDFSSSDKAINGAAITMNKGGGGVTNLQISNSTFYNTNENYAFNYFIQYGPTGNSYDKFGYASATVSIDHCTLYNMMVYVDIDGTMKSGQIANYPGFTKYTTANFIMTDNIFYQCCPEIAARFLGKRADLTYATMRFNHNTYYVVNSEGNLEAESGSSDSHDWDNSGNVIMTDPLFADAANGDFTISGSEQVAAKTGDPRWLPEE